MGCVVGGLGCPARLSSPVALTLALSRRAGEGNLPTPPRLPSPLLPVRPWVPAFAGMKCRVRGCLVINSRAMTTVDKYRSTSSSLFDQAHVELEAGDLIQASEKFWGAAAQSLKAIAQQRGWEHDSHAHFFTIVRNIIDETDDKEILDLFNAANLLHVNFYEGMLREDEVLRMSGRVGELVNRLDEILN